MAIQASPQFVALRRRHRRVTFLTLTAFSCWFMAYVLFVDYAPGIMTIQLLGKINVGLVLGIVQIVGVLTGSFLYYHFAKHVIDPQIDEIRRQAGVVQG